MHERIRLSFAQVRERLPKPHLRIDPRAQDIADVLGNPDLIPFIEKHRLKQIGYAVATSIFLGLETHASFTINTLASSPLIYGVAVAGETAISLLNTRDYTAYYNKIVTPATKIIDSFTPDDEERFRSHLREAGIPSFSTWSKSVWQTLRLSNNPKTREFISLVLTPLTQALVAAPYIGLGAALGGTIFAYGGGYALGTKFQEFWKKLETEHLMWRDALSREAALGIQGDNVRSDIINDKIQSNMRKYNLHWIIESLAGRTPKILTAATMIAKNGQNALGWMHFFANDVGGGLAVSEFIKNLPEDRYKTEAVRLAAEFMSTNFFHEKDWKAWIDTQPPHIEQISKQSDREFCRFEQYKANIPGVELPDLTQSIEVGRAYLLRAPSGGGKSTLANAATARLPHTGDLFIDTNNDGSLTNQKSLSLEETRRHVVRFSSDYINTLPGRPVDYFVEGFLTSMNDTQRQQLLDNNAIQEALIIPDSDLEKQLDIYTNSDHHHEFIGEAFGKMDQQTLALIQHFRQLRYNYVANQLKKFGANMDNIDSATPMVKLSSGQKTRVILGSIISNLGGRDHKMVIIMDEPVNAVDAPSSGEMIKEMANLLKHNPSLAMIIVSHTHTEIISQAFSEVLGEEGFSTIHFAANNTIQQQVPQSLPPV